MGKRKFRLKSVKNYERKRYQRRAAHVHVDEVKVSIPHQVYTCRDHVDDHVHVDELKVSIPLHVYTCRDRVDKLNISIPLHIYTSLPSTDAGILYSRLDKLKVLPEGWVTSSILVFLHHYLHCITNLHVFLLVILVLTSLVC